LRKPFAQEESLSRSTRYDAPSAARYTIGVISLAAASPGFRPGNSDAKGDFRSL
jgi:hypothetical protein